MNHPPYHLRLNKAIERFIFIDAIRKLERFGDLSEYTYYGLGGPYLEDFRLLYEFCPGIGMVSIEEKPDTLKRQKFHQVCKTLRLVGAEISTFLAEYESANEKSIFWLDYTKLNLGAFEDFKVLLEKVAANSIVKLTLQAMPKDYKDKGAKFREQFGAFMPDPLANPPFILEDYVLLLQDMLQIASQQVLPATGEMTYQPLTSFFYADGATMFTLTGIVCRRSDQKRIRGLFKNWHYANLDWDAPTQISIPFLSTKERLHLQRHLPLKQNTGRRLLKVLGYTLDEDEANSIVMLKQYADFYKYYPFFVKAAP